MRILSDERYPRYKVTFGGVDEFRDPLVVDAEEFIGAKSYKAKGKRITNFDIASIDEIEPREVPEEETPAVDIEVEEVAKDDVINQNDVRDELTGQTRLFEDEDL